MLWQPVIDQKYTAMSDEELVAAIRARKAELGGRLVILGHHYQQDDVIQFADYLGDSFKLSQLAAESVAATGAKYVIFAGVHFMAESADILTPDDVQVILPDLSAGCSMADMADIDDTIVAWGEIQEAIKGENCRVVPICYMNCTAAIKAFCAEHGGAVCTSSNAQKILQWALAGGGEGELGAGEQVKILFLPDQHLGRNTGADMGYDPDSDMVVWDPQAVDELAGLAVEDLKKATFILWKGHCSVHKLFRPEHVDQFRRKYPEGKVIVHPECVYEVAVKADMTGSTEKIIQVIEGAAAGSEWAVGTEVHLVNRVAMAAAKRGVTVKMLSECQCLCTTMYRIDQPHLLWVMDELVEGNVVNRIKVPAEIRKWATVAMERMLEITAKGGVGVG